MFVACGDAGSGTSESGTTGSTGASTDGASTDGASSTSGASTTTGTTGDPTDGGVMTTPATASTSATGTTDPGSSTDPLTTTGTTGELTTGTVTTDATTSTTTGTETSDGTESTGPMPVAEYAADFWSGGLDHLTVRKADPVADLCTSIRFARPGLVMRPGLQLPPDWWYQGADIHQGAANCLDFMAPLPGLGSSAIAAEGTGTWEDLPFCPKTVDVDITLTFAQDQPWVPLADVLFAAAIPVSGC